MPATEHDRAAAAPPAAGARTRFDQLKQQVRDVKNEQREVQQADGVSERMRSGTDAVPTERVPCCHLGQPYGRR